MAQKDYEKEIQGIRTETEKIKREIMKFEFQYKKDLAEARKEFQGRDEQIQKRIDYLAKLAGITYEELDLLEFKLQETGRVLARPREHSKR